MNYPTLSEIKPPSDSPKFRPGDIVTVTRTIGKTMHLRGTIVEYVGNFNSQQWYRCEIDTPVGMRTELFPGFRISLKERSC